MIPLILSYFLIFFYNLLIINFTLLMNLFITKEIIFKLAVIIYHLAVFILVVHFNSSFIRTQIVMFEVHYFFLH